MFNIYINNNSINLYLKSNLFYNNIFKLNDLFIKHKLFKFKLNNSINNNLINSDYLDNNLFDDIDCDNNSLYSPVEVYTSVFNIWSSDYIELDNYNNMFNLLKYYSYVYFNNELVNLLIYSINL